MTMFQKSLRWDLLAALRRAGGTVTDRPSGRATTRLLALAGSSGRATAASSVLRELEDAGVIMRETNGKRTYEIVLVEIPHEWMRYVDAVPKPVSSELGGVVEGSLSSESTDRQAEGALTSHQSPVAPDVAVLPRPAEIDYGQLAHELLRKAVEVIDKPISNQVDARRLSDTIEENQRLRAKNSSLTDENRAVMYERDGLRQKVRTLEMNLQSTLKDGSRIVNGEVRKGIARFMEEKPRPGIRVREDA